MLNEKGHYICDAELGQPGHWRGCKRRAVVEREAELITMHYCDKHQGRAHNPLPHHFVPKPGSRPYALTVPR